MPLSEAEDALSEVEYAAMNGRLDIVEQLHASSTVIWSTCVMDAAARNGHLDVIQWLHANRTEGCTTWAMDWAAFYGHLDVVQWLHTNRSEGCTTFAMDWAAMNGHLDVVQWLHANRSEGCTTYAMVWAAENGHLDVRAFLTKINDDALVETQDADWSCSICQTSNEHSKLMTYMRCKCQRAVAHESCWKSWWRFTGSAKCLYCR